jgi:C4-dicarboxylate-specific signal transduction histidine kinase
MPAGGTLEVSLEEHGGYSAATFVDSGPGLAPEIVPRLFEPFGTTK